MHDSAARAPVPPACMCVHHTLARGAHLLGLPQRRVAAAHGQVHGDRVGDRRRPLGLRQHRRQDPRPANRLEPPVRRARSGAPALLLGRLLAHESHEPAAERARQASLRRHVERWLRLAARACSAANVGGSAGDVHQGIGRASNALAGSVEQSRQLLNEQPAVEEQKREVGQGDCSWCGLRRPYTGCMDSGAQRFEGGRSGLGGTARA